MVRQTTLRANVARIGAGMLVSGRAELTNVTFSGNNAFQSGGGLFVSEGNPRATLHHVTNLRKHSSERHRGCPDPRRQLRR